MSTRSSMRNLFPPLDNSKLTIRRRSRANPTLLNDFEMTAEGPGDDANKHLDKFLHVTQSIKVNGVTDVALRLYLFPHSLTHHATAWFDRLLRNSINTFEQMAKMFLGKYFPPSMVTKLRNEITNFRQHPDESLFEAWERYMLSIDRFPNHHMLPVTQIDTFYNGLTLRHRDTINAATGGTFMKRRPEACYDLIENMTAHHNDWDTSAQLTSKSKQLLQTVKLVVVLIPSLIVQPLLATLKTYMLREPIKGASHGQNPPPAYQAPAYQAPAYQAMVYQSSVHQPQIPQPQVVTTNEFTNFMKANDAILKNMQTNMTSLTNSNLELKNMFGQFMKMNTASSSGSGTLPGNTITTSKEELKGITTRSETAYQGPTIPTTTSSSLPLIVERETEIESLILNSEPVVAPIIEPVASPVSASKPNQRPSIPYPSRFQDQKLHRSISRPVGVAEYVYVKVGKFYFPTDFVVVDFDAYSRVPLILERYFLKTERALIDVFEGELTLRVGKEAITFNLDQTLRYSPNYNDITENRIDVIDMAYEEYWQEVLGYSDVIASGNPTPYYDPIISTTSSTLTPFENSDFLLEEVDAFLALEDNPTSPEVDQSYVDTEGDILLLKAFLNPSLPPPNKGNYLPQVRKELKIYKAKTDKSSIDEPFEVEQKDLPPYLKYVFLEGDDKFLVIIAKDLIVEEKTALITILKSHKRAIAWKFSDINGLDPEFCTHKILMEEDFEPAVQHQRRANAKIDDVIRNEVLKLLDAGLIYVISDSHWEKSHFMVKEGIVVDYKISKNEIEVNKAKVDVIAKLPHPTTVKECVEAFQTLKRKLTEASILIAHDWDLPFELMCDANDFPIGAVLGLCKLSSKEFRCQGNVVPTEKHILQGYLKPPEPLSVIEERTSAMTSLQRIVGENRASWSDKLDDALWAFRTAYKTPIGCTLYKLVYGKACHLLIELEDKAYWALKHENFDLQTTGDHKKVQLNELNELRDQTYENSLIYKEKTKRIHDSKIKDHVFNIDDRGLLFNSRLKIFSGKLKSRWSGPFTISHVFPYGIVKLS
uniref:Reverse transcriptase domain-containing protein n=1 Tax=Tanacetum cinerariifolium TaxID=118510 RepID=A0A6L2LGH7_TANCI|nr:reverse transcriptase domain-containing protein [Tanacetum cinerariifolium]